MPSPYGPNKDSIGISSHKNQYRASVLQGNWAEERGAADSSAAAAPRPRCAGESTSHAAHGPQGKFGLDIARHRYDWDREEAPSALAGDAALSCYTTLYQLAFATCWDKQKVCTGEAKERRTQELLWSGRKAVDYKVPRQTEHHTRIEARETTAHEASQRALLGGPGALAAAAALPKGGPCARHFDKTWLRIRLRQ